MNQPLSSDHSQPGDAFTASLVQPVIANGLVVARRGQTVGGRIADVQKAGRVKGTSQLGLQLTELSLVDGQQVPVITQLIERRGDTSVGADVAAVGITSGLGAAIGAAAGGGWGAGIGALAGAAVGTTGVLATRGRPSVVFPESVLTFRLEQPLTFTPRGEQAYLPPSPQDNQAPVLRSAPRPAYPSPYPAPYPSYYAGYPPYFGPSFYFYSGPGYFRGYYRRW